MYISKTKALIVALVIGLLAALVGIQPASAQPGQETSTRPAAVQTAQEDYASPYSEVSTSCNYMQNSFKSVAVDANLYNFGTVVLGYEITVYYTNNRKSWKVQELGLYDVYPDDGVTTINLLTLDKNTVKYLGKKYKYFSIEINVLDTATSFASDWTKVKTVRKGAVCNRLLPGEGVEGL